MNEPLIDAWYLCCAHTICLLDYLSPEQWAAAAPAGKPIRAQFAHLHNVRLMWLKMADKSLIGGLTKAPRHNASPREVRFALIESGIAAAAMLRSAQSPDTKIKGLGKPPTEFLVWAAAHEGYHRGQIELTLRQCGMELPAGDMLRLWDHSKMAKLALELFAGG